MAVTITERAAEEIKRVVSEKQMPEDTVLRIGVAGGGCSGFSYSLDLTETKTDADEAWEQHGVEVVCDSKSLLYLDGVSVDFKDEMMGRGFVFTNPNATSSCGCGSSFSV